MAIEEVIIMRIYVIGDIGLGSSSSTFVFIMNGTR